MDIPVTRAEVFIVDDDASVRNALTTAFVLHGYRVTCFADTRSFRKIARGHAPQFVLLDMNIPFAAETLAALRIERYPTSVVAMSSDCAIPAAVAAMRAGAIDFIEKPFDATAVPARLRAALESPPFRDMSPRPAMNGRLAHASLTPRERDVAALIADAASNKEAGRRLGISPRTVEVHRARIMTKLGAKNTADLVRIVLADSPA